MALQHIAQRPRLWSQAEIFKELAYRTLGRAENDIHHNGKLVLGESMGDPGGAQIAFLAHEKPLAGKPRPADIDGFTPEQQFFICVGTISRGRDSSEKHSG